MVTPDCKHLPYVWMVARGGGIARAAEPDHRRPPRATHARLMPWLHRQVSRLHVIGEFDRCDLHIVMAAVYRPMRVWSRNKKAHEPKFVGFLLILGRPCGIRTCDQRIKSPLLYQLS
jgi:hypothetical protein